MTNDKTLVIGHHFMSEQHEQFIRLSIQLAQEAADRGDQPFGAVLVHDGQVILTARNSTMTKRDVTAHAETALVRKATALYDRDFLATCTLYTSTEPCAMCTGAIVWSGISQIVYSCGAEMLGQITGEGTFIVPSRDLLTYAKFPPVVVGPILEEESVTVHAAFWPDYLAKR